MGVDINRDLKSTLEDLFRLILESPPGKPGKRNRFILTFKNEPNRDSEFVGEFLLLDRFFGLKIELFSERRCFNLKSGYFSSQSCPFRSFSVHKHTRAEK